MTDELKAKFQALVKDAPEPAGRPSDAVFARIKTVRRRRTTGLVAGLATAAVATIALAAGNLTGIDSAPPVTETPNGPTPTAIVPTTTPTSTPTGPKASIAVSAQTLEPGNQETGETDTPPPNKPSPPGKPSSNTTDPVAPPGPYRLSFRFDTAPDPDPAESLNVTAIVVATGSVLAPADEEGGNLSSSRFHDNLLFSEYWWGDGTYVEDDWYGGYACPQPDDPQRMKKVTGSGNQVLAHKYAKPGTYKLTYSVTYCTPSGPVKFSRSTNLTVTKPPASPKP
jgi:hypothetical protein